MQNTDTACLRLVSYLPTSRVRLLSALTMAIGNVSAPAALMRYTPRICNSLQSLPGDILLEISEHLIVPLEADPDHILAPLPCLAALSLTCRQVYEFVSAALYAHIHATGHSQTSNLFALLNTRSDLASHICTVRVKCASRQEVKESRQAWRTVIAPHLPHCVEFTFEKNSEGDDHPSYPEILPWCSSFPRLHTLVVCRYPPSINPLFHEPDKINGASQLLPQSLKTLELRDYDHEACLPSLSNKLFMGYCASWVQNIKFSSTSSRPRRWMLENDSLKCLAPLGTSVQLLIVAVKHMVVDNVDVSECLPNLNQLEFGGTPPCCTFSVGLPNLTHIVVKPSTRGDAYDDEDNSWDRTKTRLELLCRAFEEDKYPKLDRLTVHRARIAGRTSDAVDVLINDVGLRRWCDSHGIILELL